MLEGQNCPQFNFSITYDFAFVAVYSTVGWLYKQILYYLLALMLFQTCIKLNMKFGGCADCSFPSYYNESGASKLQKRCKRLKG